MTHTPKTLPWKRNAARALALAALLAAAPAGAGDSLVGKIVEVKAGNRIVLDYGAGTYDVRLTGIATEKDRGAADAAGEAMRRLGLGRTVRLRFEGRDENGDMVGRLWLSDYANLARAPRDLGVELVRTGLARMEGDGGAYKYGELAAAEAFARSQNLGLWKSEKEGRP